MFTKLSDRLNYLSESQTLAMARKTRELREQGHQIHTARITITDRNGFAHGNVARYVLLKLAGGEHAAI